MNKLTAYFQKIALAKFAAIMVLFLLPFVNVSCSGIAAFTLTGADLAMGTTIETQNPIKGRPSKTVVQKQPAAGVALAAAVLGLVGTLVFKGAMQGRVVVGAAASGFAALLWLQNTMNTQAMSKGQGLLIVQWQVGYWLALGLFLAAVGLALAALLKSRAPVQTNTAKGVGAGEVSSK